MLFTELDSDQFGKKFGEEFGEEFGEKSL